MKLQCENKNIKKYANTIFAFEYFYIKYIAWSFYSCYLIIFPIQEIHKTQICIHLKTLQYFLN